MNKNSNHYIESSKILPLTDLCMGKKCKVKTLTSSGSIRRRMLDLGLISNTEIEVLNQSPSGDPVAYLIRGAVIAIRKEDASNILVEAL
ncbi:FeoA family protein [Clostridium subterminale]|uniref:FeoA family protein n=1 Tax=Clostridium subterminale TaxID=1550 RepID=A0ABN1KHA0_CLOSU